MYIPSGVPLPEQNPCCWSMRVLSYNDLILFMIVITRILHKTEPTCNALLVFGSDGLPLKAPFHKATSFESVQELGIVCDKYIIEKGDGPRLRVPENL